MDRRVEMGLAPIRRRVHREPELSDRIERGVGGYRGCRSANAPLYYRVPAFLDQLSRFRGALAGGVFVDVGPLAERVRPALAVDLVLQPPERPPGRRRDRQEQSAPIEEFGDGSLLRQR